MLVQLNLYLLKSAFKSPLDINERSVFTSIGILRKSYTSSLFKTQAFFKKENLTQNPFNKIFWKLWSRQYFDLHMTKFESKMQQIQKIVQNSHPSDNELHDLTCWLWCKKYYLKYAGLDFKHGHLDYIKLVYQRENSFDKLPTICLRFFTFKVTLFTFPAHSKTFIFLNLETLLEVRCFFSRN